MGSMGMLTVSIRMLTVHNGPTQNCPSKRAGAGFVQTDLVSGVQGVGPDLDSNLNDP
jgi:hypothetical protein